ncbi:MAG: hypothetical protein AMK74_00510 [Nitrospira bacterium SM23_35]|nr:MAG: hypothetical protein AMK74_00510 [Nitrospira bacterium SM23_35]
MRAGGGQVTRNDISINAFALIKAQNIDLWCEEENMSRLKSCLLVAFVALVLGVCQSEAKTIIGEGFGTTREEAKKAALSDLSSAIQVEVQSSFESMVKEVNQKVEEFTQNVITLKSELPILGAEYEFRKGRHGQNSTAILDSDNVLKLYGAKIVEIKQNMKTYQALIDKSISRSEKYQLYTELLTYLKQYYKYKTVAILLGSKGIPEIDVTEVEIKNQLRRLREKIDDLNMAAKLIAEAVADRDRIYIYPPTTRDSHEITQFADVVKRRLSVYLKTVQDPRDASFFMKGGYSILDDGKGGIELTYYLLDNGFNTLKTNVTTLLPESYSGYEVKPKTLSFDKLLYEGFAVSNEFKIDITTNSGRENLLFKEGEEAEFLVKMNNPGYFYIVGHVVKPGDEEYSYLVDFDDTGQIRGGRKFIRYVNIDDVNKWIGLGRFEIVAPFGVESLQVIASSNDLIDRLPSHGYDDETQLYVVSRDPNKAVMNTRAIKKKISKEVKSAETVLLFTTMKK